MGQDAQVAVFIDYQNLIQGIKASYGLRANVDWNRIFNYAAKMGRVAVRRAYADWSVESNKQDEILGQGVELIHLNRKRGKNAINIRIVIDTLELFYFEMSSFTHLLLVSGDGDFTELAQRMRLHGKIIVGMGLSTASNPYLVNACDSFIYYDKGRARTIDIHEDGQVLVDRPAMPHIPVRNRSISKHALDRYLDILAFKNIRIVPTTHRPLIIYKMYEIIKTNPDFRLQEFADLFFSNGTANIETSLVKNVANQLFRTSSFEFEEGEGEGIWTRRMTLAKDVTSPADLLEKCDRKLLSLIQAELKSGEELDAEAVAIILYGEVRNSRVITHVQELLASIIRV